MSVIAKLMVRNTHEFGTGQLTEFGCVCENDLMAAYATSDEDKLFTKYSPWGEMKISTPSQGAVFAPWRWEPGDPGAPPAYYVLALHKDEHEFVEPTRTYGDDENFPGCAAWSFGSCVSVTDFGGTKQVKFGANKGGSISSHGRLIDAMVWKMSVDNPAASDQFKPGETYWFVLYDAAKFDMRAAIRAAHGHGE